jgi:GNAT superfamily N-acetyltransferase
LWGCCLLLFLIAMLQRRGDNREKKDGQVESALKITKKRKGAAKRFMTSELLIRQATLEDWEQLFPLLCVMGGVDSEDQAKQRFREVINRPDHSLPVALLAGQLVGYGWAQDYGPHVRTGDRTARLHDLCVHPEYRGRGIGARLFTSVKAWAEQAGVRYLQWQASLSATGFYQRLGYVGDPCPQPEHPFFEIEFPR